MLNMSLIDINYEPIHFVHFNTDTVWDLLTGTFVRGTSGEWLLDGGLPALQSCIVGKEQCYKSTLLMSLFGRVMVIYKEIKEALEYDSENTLINAEQRLISLFGKENGTELYKRLKLISPAHGIKMGELFKIIIGIVKKKMENINDYKKETPFLNTSTGKGLKTLIPTPIIIDSYSALQSKVELDDYDKKNLETDTNTLYMKDANTKTKFTRAANGFCGEAGIMLLSTGHVGDISDIGPFPTTTKQLQYQKHNTKIKQVGSQYTFLNTIAAEVQTPKPLQDSNKECKYPVDYDNNPVELNEIIITLQRCKNNTSGKSIPIVVSQYEGLLEEVTEYSILTNTKMGNGFGFSKQRAPHHLLLLPDVSINAKNLRTVVRDYKVKRALQITFHLYFIQAFWNTSNFPYKVDYKPEEFVEAIKKSKKLTIDKILNSRSYWVFDPKKEKYPYLSIMDILEILESERK
jgi:hypothetical protein